MKLTAFFILATCLHVNATDGYGQKVTLSEREVHIEKIFSVIKKQTGFNFLYTSNILAGTHRVTVNVTNALVTEVLDIVLAGQGLEYRVKREDNLIIIKTAPPLPVKPTTQVVQGEGLIEVRGVITDENGAPANGVNVVVKGTNKGTTTNYRGEFVLRDVKEGAVLLISSVGYDRQEVLVKNRDFVRSQLKVAVGNLDEMQVIAYGVTSKRFNTGNVSTIKSSDIEKQPVQNPLLALQGRIPGLFITQANGVPGGGITVRMQGINSLRNGSDPLYIVDGVPFSSQLEKTGLSPQILGNSGGQVNGFSSGIGNPLNYINPSEIESIEVLKDADATAIYGSRAANGAILITTKRGKAGATRFNSKIQQGISKVAKEVKMLNTKQYLEMRREAFINDGIALPSLALNPNDVNWDINGLWDTTSFTNWQKVLIGSNAKYTNIDATISGGTPSVQYLVGANYNRQTTVYPGSFENRRGSIHFNISSTSLNQKFIFRLTGSYLRDNNKLPSTDLTRYAITTEPLAPSLYTDDGKINWAPNALGNSTWTNPLAFLLQSYQNKTNNLISNAVVKFRAFEGLEISSSFGYTNLDTKDFSPFPLEAVRPERRNTTDRNGLYGNRNVSTWLIEPQLNYNKNFKEAKIDFLFGGTVQQNVNQGESYIGSGYSTDFLINNIKNAGSITLSNSFFTVYKYNAVFGRLNYNLKSRYIVNLTARRDGSSRFGYENQLQNFYAIGGAWLFSEEKLVKDNLRIMSFGKIKGSFGVTGSDQIGDYNFMSLYSTPSNIGVAYQNAPSLGISNLSNPYLEWEKTKKLQIGLELGFLNDRFILSVGYIDNKSSNQLVSSGIPYTTGFSSIAENVPAKIQNKSIEGSLDITIIQSKKVKWKSGVVITIPQNKLIAFPGLETSIYNSTYIIGKPVSSTRLYHFGGVDPLEGRYQVINDQGNSVFAPSNLTDRYVIFTTYPKFYGGFQNSFKYRNIQLDIFFQFVNQKGFNSLLFTNSIRNPGEFSAGSSNQPIAVLKRWRKSGDATNIQRFSTGKYNANNALGSDGAFTDASFIRLKNISLSWELSESLKQKMHLKDFRLLMQGQNLLTFTKYKGFDPENQSITSLPPLLIITFGIQVGF